jgi:hypothetical protein
VPASEFSDSSLIYQMAIVVWGAASSDACDACDASRCLATKGCLLGLHLTCITSYWGTIPGRAPN